MDGVRVRDRDRDSDRDLEGDLLRDAVWVDVDVSLDVDVPVSLEVEVAVSLAVTKPSTPIGASLSGFAATFPPNHAPWPPTFFRADRPERPAPLATTSASVAAPSQGAPES